MAFNDILFSFSPGADFFAYLSLDGCLKIWETCSDTLKQEYTPSSHLSATCTALSWGPCKQDEQYLGKKSKKAKSAKFSASIADLKLIAMGTLSGDVLLYSITSGDLHTKMSDGHNDAVNSISWLDSADSLFTCSNDHHIVRWSISEGVVLSKWKAGKSPVTCICVIDNDSLLSASSSITWWDIKTQNVLKKFTGHASEVLYLVPINVSENDVNFQYFVSAAVGDRVISVWQLSQNSDSNAVTSFTLSDEIFGLDVSENNSKSEPLIMSAVTRSGVLHIFEHQLNGKIKKPVKPKGTVHIASMAKKAEEKSQPIPVLASKIAKSLDSCYVAYGNFLRPVFEKFELQQFQEDTYLIRQNQLLHPVSFEGISKIKEPDRSNTAKVLAPGYMAPTRPTESVTKKKKRRAESSEELPMEERLNAMYLGQAPEEYEVASSNPSSESMVHLLLQGLQSKDNNLLNTVLQRSEQTLISNTVKRLPLNSIPLLLKELHKRLSKKEQGNRPCLRWLRGVLAVHLSYLMSLQEIDEYIGPVSQLIESREEVFSKMLQLKGFLDILWLQIGSKADASSNIPSKPITTYEDESSSEEQEEEEEEMEHVEFHSNFEDHSGLSSSESENEMLAIHNGEEESS